MTYLIIHFLEKPEDFQFDNSLEKSIRERVQSDDVILTADNFSDAYLVQQYLKEIEQSESITVICQFSSENVKLGAGLTLLNALIRKKDVSLQVNLEHPQMIPFMRKFNGQIRSDF